MHFQWLTSLTMGLLLIALPSANSAEVEEAKNVETALSELDAWLADSPDGAAWRNYLQLDALRKDVAKDDPTEMIALESARRAFASGTPGLDRKPFVAASHALEAWYLSKTNWRLEELPAAIEEAKATFAPVTPQEIERRRQVLLFALGEFEEFLKQADAATQQGWKTFFDWDNLQREAAKTASPDPAILNAALQRLNGVEVGLELDPIVAVRRALRSYYNGLAVAANPNAEQAYRDIMDELKRVVEEYVANPTAENASIMGDRLGFLGEISQAPQIVAGVNRLFDEPNFRMVMSRELLAANLERDVDEPAEVQEVIMDTRVRGYGRTRGRIHVALTPNDERAELVLNLVAQANTQNVGVNGPVTIYSTGRSDVQAWHTVFVDEFGFTRGDVTARGCVHTNIYCISAKHRLVELIAWKKAQDSLPEAEAIASGRAGMRAREQFADQIREQLAEPNKSFQEKLRGPALRYQVMPELLRFRTTADEMLVAGRHANERQLGSPTKQPADVGGDFSVKVHESAVGNFSESAFAGKTYTGEEFAEMMKKAPAALASEGEADTSDREWSVTFRERAPMLVDFRDNLATAHIYLAKFSNEGTESNYPVEITATYAIESTPEGPQLVRQDEVKIIWDSMKRPGFAQRAALGSKFRHRFEAMLLREKLFAKDVAPKSPEGFGVLRDHALHSADGWFTVGMTRIPPK